MRRNPWKEAAQLRKASSLAVCFAQAGVSLQDVERMNDEEWAMAAKAASVSLPSAETRGMVVSFLRPPVKRSANPFAGFEERKTA